MSTENQAGRPAEAAPMTPQGAARRRLAKAGLGAAGVLWTTRSHALDFKCVSASAALSAGLNSNTPDNAVACAGKSPGHWKNHGGWPVSTKTLFGDVFSCSGRTASTYGATTLINMLSKRDFDKSNLGMHMTAAYLNVKSGKIGFLSERSLQQMWRELQTSGHYEPARGVFWDIETTKKYLESTYKGDRT
ncbi:hypothetical protein ACWV27_01975 [Massilia varians]